MTAQRRWVRTVFQPLVVAAMMACLAVSVVRLLQLLVPTWSGAYLITIVFLAAAEAQTASRLIRRHRLRAGERLSFRAGEWLLILVALKLGSYVPRGFDALLADQALWRTNISTLFTIEYIIAIVLTAFTWIMATDIEHDLTTLATPGTGVQMDREEIQSQLMSRFFWGGLVLLITAGIARIGVAQMLELAHPPVPGIVLNALLYFMLGLLLLSQVRLAALEVRWQVREVEAAADVSNRWSRTSVIFLLLMGALALILPTSYSYGLIESLGLALSFVIELVYSLAALLVLVLTLPFALLLSLFGVSNVQPAFPPGLATPPPATPQPEAGPSWWGVVRSLIFWGLVLGIAIYTLRSYVDYRRDLLSGSQVGSWLGRLWTFLASLWEQARHAAAETVEPIRRRLAEVERPRIESSVRAPWRWRRLSSMSPRERIRYYYLSIVHRGKQAGRVRYKSETPREYSASLRETKPDVEPDLSELTEAFIEARYSRHDIAEARADILRRSWNRVKRALRS